MKIISIQSILETHSLKRVRMLMKHENYTIITQEILSQKYPNENFWDVDFSNLPQDDYCGTVIAGQKIIGHNKKTGNKKQYFCLCVMCAEEPLMNGLGIYMSSKANLLKEAKPCACAKRVNLTEYQFLVRTQQQLNNIPGKRFYGFPKVDKLNAHTVAIIGCESHNTVISNISINTINTSVTTRDQTKCGKIHYCLRCSYESSAEKNLLDDDVVATEISRHKNNINVIFVGRSENNAKNGKYQCKVCSSDEFVINGLCNGIFETYIHNLYNGHLGCRCSSNYRYTIKQLEYLAKKELIQRNNEDETNHEFISVSGDYKYNAIVMLKNNKTDQPERIRLQSFLSGGGLVSDRNQNVIYEIMIYLNGIPVGIKLGLASNGDPTSRINNFGLAIKRYNAIHGTEYTTRCGKFYLFSADAARFYERSLHLLLRESHKNLFDVKLGELGGAYTETYTIDTIPMYQEFMKKCPCAIAEYNF